MTDNKNASQDNKAIVSEITDKNEASKPLAKKKASKPKSTMEDALDALKPETTPQNTEQAENAQLSAEEARKVIDAVEPLIQQNKKALRPKNLKAKSINLYNDQPLQVTLESGVVMTLNFTAPVPK